jgi:hypothetical protein
MKKVFRICKKIALPNMSLGKRSPHPSYAGLEQGLSQLRLITKAIVLGQLSLR